MSVYATNAQRQEVSQWLQKLSHTFCLADLGDVLKTNPESIQQACDGSHECPDFVITHLLREKREMVK